MTSSDEPLTPNGSTSSPSDSVPSQSGNPAAEIEPPLIELVDDAELEPVDLSPRDMERYECRSCGYTYEPLKGDQQNQIPAGVPFEDLPDSWRCPVCSATTRQFEGIGPAGKPSGFDENLGYGFGVNVMTPGQKNIAIFGALAVAFAMFMSLYLLN